MTSVSVVCEIMSTNKQVIQEMWAQDPEDRPSAQAVVAQLEAILRQLGVQPSTPVVRFPSALVSERPEPTVKFPSALVSERPQGDRGGRSFGVP